MTSGNEYNDLLPVSPLNKAFGAIISEREYQDAKWNKNHSNTEFLVYIRDYVEEALHFSSREADDKCLAKQQDSLRKIAALAVAAMEQNGSRPRE
jgi:hypothetical protein